MSYSKIYRGEFANALADGNDQPVEQIVRIDISDTSKGTVGGTIQGNVIIMSGPALNTSPIALAPGASLADRTVNWQTYADFFFVGMRLRVTGTSASDGDYYIATILEFTPTAVVDDAGSLDITLTGSAPGTSLGEHDITFENITTPEIIPLEMDGDPLRIATIDDEEDKFTPIRGKQAEIKINTNSAIDIDTFCEADDETFYVEIFVDDKIIFRGYLIIPDMEQNFMPDPNIFKLAAVDNLGTLKSQELVDLDGNYPIGKFKLIDYISWALKKTGVIQNINVVNNLKHGSGTFTTEASFSSAGHSFALNASFANKIYKGQKLTISGTANNNGVFTVVDSALFTGLYIVVVHESVTDESGGTATFSDNSSAAHFYETVYLDAKTFEKQIGLGEDFYTVIRKILLEDSVLFQSKGEWYIIRIDEFEDFSGIFQMDVSVFNSNGEFQTHDLKTFAKSVGISEIETFYNEDTVIIPDRAHRFIKETFKYNTPLETICNSDFSRGDFIEDVDPTSDEQADGAITAKTFELDDWILMRGYPEAPGSPIANDSTVFIKRLYNVVDYEDSRFIVMTPPSAPNEASPYILSCALPVKKLDRFESSVNFRFPSNPTFNFFAPIFQFALKGIDGSWWLLTISDSDIDLGSDAAGPRWVDTNGWTVNSSLGDYHLITSGTGATDFTKNQLLSYDFRKVPPIPIDGKLYILLHGLNISDEDSTDNIDVYYSSLSFTYYPFINGSYQKYTGQYHKISQDTKNKATRDNEVFMSDSPRILFKGSMLIFNGSDYVLSSFFTDHNHSIGRPYGEIQAYAVWNQYRKSARNFDGNVDFLESETEMDSQYDGIDLLHKIDLTDIDRNTANRYFMILHYEQDFNMLAMKAYIASLYRTDLGKVYTDTHEFKYITE